MLVISADRHAGPETMRGYRDHVDARHLDDFDRYCAAIDEYDRAIAQERGSNHNNAGGGFVRHKDDLETGLWDPDAHVPLPRRRGHRG